MRTPSLSPTQMEVWAVWAPGLQLASEMRSVLCLTPGASARMEARFWMPVGVRETENAMRREPQTSKWLKQTQWKEQNTLTPSDKKFRGMASSVRAASSHVSGGLSTLKYWFFFSLSLCLNSLTRSLKPRTLPPFYLFIHFKSIYCMYQYIRTASNRNSKWMVS